MKRREFLLGSAGIVGTLRFAQAHAERRPCPVPLVELPGQHVETPCDRSPGLAATPLERAAKALAAGQSVEFLSSDLVKLGSIQLDDGQGGSEYLAWNSYFHWDEVRKEAQCIGIGVGFTPVKHGLYVASENKWYRVPGYSPQPAWGASTYGHPFQMHVLSPDGTYWVQRSGENSLQYRKRADWAETPWRADRKTPAFPGASSIYASYTWHNDLNLCIYRLNTTVMTLDLLGFLSTGTLATSNVSGMPAYSAEYLATRYCRAIKAAIAFGRNDSEKNDGCSLIRKVGAVAKITPLPNGPPRTVIHGLDGTPLDDPRYALFVDDPDGETAYLIGLGAGSSPAPVWKMKNVGESWDGTWVLAGSTDVFTKARQDAQPRGTLYVVCAPIYGLPRGDGVAWIMTQSSTARLDSFLWKPPA